MTSVTTLKMGRDPDLNKSTLSDDEFMDYVKNVYRVLLTRGMKGCYVYFVDKGTEKHFRKRIRDETNG